MLELPDSCTICGEKEESIDPEYQSLQKCAAVVAKFYKYLPHDWNYKLLVDNWFFTLALIHKLTKMGILAVGTVRLSSTQISPFQWNKDFEKKTAVVL